MSRRDEIEQNVRVIATAGALLFVGLVGTLFFVQVRMAASQALLAESVVPLQSSLAGLSSGVGEVFSRQSQTSSTRSLAQFVALGEDASLEQRVREAGRAATGAIGHLDAAPTPVRTAAEKLAPQLDQFLAADRALLDSIRRRHTLQARFDREIKAVEGELRELTEASFAVSGVLRLQHVALLRKVAAQTTSGQVVMRDVRASVLGAERAQLDAMNQLDAAVLRLAALAGKVGLASDVDGLNSIAANEFAQTRTQVERTLAEVARLSSNSPELAARVSSLQLRATALLGHIGDEGRDDSLVALRRHVFVEWQRADTTRASAMASAGALQTALVVFDRFATERKVASTLQATSTVWLARAVSVGISLIGLGVCVMAAMRLRRSIVALHSKNAALSDLSTNLERKVDERTAALNSRERAMQLVLDSTGEGLVTAALDGTLLPERSRAMTQWFGSPVPGQRLWDLLFPQDSNAAASLRVGYEQLGEGFMPFEVAVDQMSRRVPFGTRTLELDFRQVLEADRLSAVLVIVRDITRRVEAEQAEFASREMQALVGSILRDQAGFTRTVNECEGLIGSLMQCDLVTGRRALHTLKGNSALAGFLSMAEAVHALETKLEEEERHLRPEEQLALDTQWKSSLARISEYLSRDASGRVELDLDELGSFERKLEGRVEHSVLLEEVRGWRAEPAAVVLQRLGAQAKRLAPKLGRQIRVELKHHQLRLPPERFDSFFAAAVHLVRNAVDHGLEAPQERLDAGKDATGLLVFETRVRGGALEIVIEDDGRGINWPAVRAAAQRKGLPFETEEQLIDAMFSDGVSSRTEVTEVSGRGVGLAAVRESVRGEGGKISVASRLGQGTRFEFTFPLLTVARAA